MIHKPTIINVDWLSFTMYDAGDIESNDMRRSAKVIRANVLLAQCGIEEAFQHKSTRHSRKPYTRAFKLFNGGGHLFFHDDLPYHTVELEGTALQRIQNNDREALHSLMTVISDNVTRFDIAIDIETETSPIKFCEAGYSKRFATYGINASDSGETYYIGSSKSDVMCRVYRYAPPHPRAKYLRIEIVLRRDRAKAAVQAWLEDGPIKTAAAAAAIFAFEHPEMALDDAVSLPVPRERQKVSSTMRWLQSQVKPAILKLANSGEVSQEWWSEFFRGMPECRIVNGDEREGNDTRYQGTVYDD